MTDPWAVENARRVLAESKATPSIPADAARWWGRNEAALEALLAYVDEQAGR